MVSDSDVDRAIEHLGYPVLDWSFTLIRSRMNSILTISSASETRLIAVLDNCDSVQAARLAYILASSGVQVLPGGTVYYRSAKLAELNRELSYWRNELSTLLSVPILPTLPSSSLRT
jgi:hypothetical protein